MLMWIALIAANQLSLIPSNSIPVLLSEFCLQFFLGCASAFLVLRFQRGPSFLIFILGTCLLVLLWYLELSGIVEHHQRGFRLLYGIAFSVIIVGMVSYELKSNIKLPSILLTIGGASYSIYLSHLFFSGIYYKIFDIIGLLEILPIPISAILLIVITVISSIYLSKLVEIPISKWARVRLSNVKKAD